MNKESVCQRLLLLLRGILYHDDFFAELVNLIAETGIESSFFKKFIARLRVLNQLGIGATKQKEFESIGDHLYSMHFSDTSYNIRVLYSFLPNGQPVLLLAFYERGGKRKTDYSSYTQPAIARLAEMKEDY